MKRAYILCLLTVYSIITFGQSSQRNIVVIGFELYDTGFDYENEGRGGAFLNGGYEFFPLKTDWLSIEPRIGVGYFRGRTKDEEITLVDHIPSSFGAAPKHSCYMFPFFFGVAPKYNIAANDDDTAFLFIENDFMFYNALARVQDEGMNKKNHSNRLSLAGEIPRM